MALVQTIQSPLETSGIENWFYLYQFSGTSFIHTYTNDLLFTTNYPCEKMLYSLR